MEWHTLIPFWFSLAYFVVAIWIVVKFYRALARIGEELSRISLVLQERLPPTNRLARIGEELSSISQILQERLPPTNPGA